jgi:hypothetical protein
MREEKTRKQRKFQQKTESVNMMQFLLLALQDFRKRPVAGRTLVPSNHTSSTI